MSRPQSPLDIPELLEQILGLVFEIRSRSIFNAARVSKQWYWTCFPYLWSKVSSKTIALPDSNNSNSDNNCINFFQHGRWIRELVCTPDVDLEWVASVCQELTALDVSQSELPRFRSSSKGDRSLLLQNDDVVVEKLLLDDNNNDTHSNHPENHNCHTTNDRSRSTTPPLPHQQHRLSSFLDLLAKNPLLNDIRLRPKGKIPTELLDQLSCQYRLRSLSLDNWVLFDSESLIKVMAACPWLEKLSISKGDFLGCSLTGHHQQDSPGIVYPSLDRQQQHARGFPQQQQEQRQIPMVTTTATAWSAATKESATFAPAEGYISSLPSRSVIHSNLSHKRPPLNQKIIIGDCSLDDDLQLPQQPSQEQSFLHQHHHHHHHRHVNHQNNHPSSRIHPTRSNYPTRSLVMDQSDFREEFLFQLLEQWSPNHYHLDHLSIKDSQGFYPTLRTFCKQLYRLCPDLQKIEFRGQVLDLTDEFFVQLIQTYPRLTMLHAAWTGFSTRALKQLMATNCETNNNNSGGWLVDLKIDGARGIQSKILQQFLETSSSRSLKKLSAEGVVLNGRDMAGSSFDGHGDEEQTGVVGRWACTGLETLILDIEIYSFGTCTKASVESIRRLVYTQIGRLTGLRHLSIGGGHSVVVGPAGKKERGVDLSLDSGVAELWKEDRLLFIEHLDLSRLQQRQQKGVKVWEKMDLEWMLIKWKRLEVLKVGWKQVSGGGGSCGSEEDGASGSCYYTQKEMVEWMRKFHQALVVEIK